MFDKLAMATRRIARAVGVDSVAKRDSVSSFHSFQYLRHNARRLEHLASLGIPVSGSSVLEVGAGIGDHSNFYIDRGCKITITEAREENLRILRRRFPACRVQMLDMDAPSALDGAPFDVTHCYGLLYHLTEPAQALAYLSANTRDMLLLETCVSYGDELMTNVVAERQDDPTQAYSGTGCRPTRAWLFKELQGLFEFVYVPTTQPWHEEFPLDWTAPNSHHEALQRTVFIASRKPLSSENLSPVLIAQQQRHQ